MAVNSKQIDSMNGAKYFTNSYLNIWDILVLTVIFFGQAIIQSTISFLDLSNVGDQTGLDLSLIQSNHYWDIALELMSLSIAGIYLLVRRFDFKQLNFRVNYYTVPLAILFACASDMATYFYDWGVYLLNAPDLLAQSVENAASSDVLHNHITPNLIVFSLLNGFYEEIFFLGLLFCIPRQYFGWMYLYSLVIRFSFHTYQGINSAIAITLLGVVFLLIRRRTNLLVPFMLAHAFFDVFGLGAIYTQVVLLFQ
ncbi:CPBP family intramembrane glutamic endopeptidase [Wohlfahrtiimonas chitiniclastica]|uniref:CPBP family intramembrane glutamic endopeptidase n=1 Tax=Wohlfahrtiimonas chitiniclastica TaxID=400946 RepID=UPI001FEEB34C|nr:CPBP family intramembrane glutamic endopeptidase [Wohlfahrtiimonas chitiniclastica]